MQLRLRTKLTIVMTGLVLLVVAVLSGVFLAQLLEQTLLETDKRASDLAHQVFVQAQHALADAANQGLRPSSDDPDDVHDYVRRAFEINAGLQAQLEAAISSPSVYEVSITDDQGLVLISNDQSLPGKTRPRRPPLSQLVQSGFVNQVKVLRGPSKIFEYDYPFNMASKPFGEVRVVLSTGLLLNEIAPSLKTSGTIVLLALGICTLLAAVVSRATLAPLRDISAQLDRISAGQYDTPSGSLRLFGGSGDELGQVSRKITQVGQQLRGVHEIFSTLRENMDSVMAGLEDGLLLFTRDARAVMVSPAAEKFLGAPAGHFLGRRVNEIFPLGHPLHEVLHVEGD
ncbi:MAG TPA: HAMP domain-containing protein, partial [Verrucomicrobiae bacterium]|nr:HAMP domain-containing protein [Verrucomicrobiae bacterium]